MDHGGLLPDHSTCRITVDELYQEFKRVLAKAGFSEARSAACARIFADNTRDGVFSHGINRFPVFVDYICRGIVDVHAEPSLVHAAGAFERWDGNRGPGPLNAQFCMGRAIEVARTNAVGVVALRNTNHWMRAGAYGLQAADADCIGICWTNTTALIPPWGGVEPKLGNNPLVICVPNQPDHVLLDMSISQFSFGRLAIAQQSGERLPVPGGFDESGELTDIAADIIRSRRPLPIGYWKGSGLAMLLDCVVSVLAAGEATSQISQRQDETNVSQVFIAIDLSQTGGDETGTVRQIIDYLHSAQTLDSGDKVTFPGERTAERRRKHLAEGISVDSKLWQKIREM